MFVRKFQAESLEEALKDIKYELGPDAIILKTVTNRGLKGAFKKSKIEITAAIPENKLKEKMVVDNALGESKNDFYENRPSYISNMISNYASHAPAPSSLPTKVDKSSMASYGNLGLNKAPLAKNAGSEITGLDSFLNSTQKKESDVDELTEKVSITEAKEAPVVNTSRSPDVSNEQYEKQQRRIETLENKLLELSYKFDKTSNVEQVEPKGLIQLRTTLRSLDVNEYFVQNLLRKASFEFQKEDLNNDEVVFEFALTEMLASINIEMPLFSSIDSDNESVITVLVSDAASGQSTMAIKLGSLKKNSVVIRNVESDENNNRTMVEKLLNLKIIRAASIPEIISATRKAVEDGKSVFIDYKNFEKEFNETKKFVEGLKRSFDKVEILVSLSAIHSELYNRKVLSTYSSLADGQIYSHLDLCLNFGAIFNLLEGEGVLPAKFFGTGTVIPDDVEAASAERVLDSIFKFD